MQLKSKSLILVGLTGLVVAVLGASNVSARRPVYSGNLLTNGGFEQAADFGGVNFGPGWSDIQTQYSYGSGHLAINALPSAHSGTKSVTVISGEGENNTGSIIQTVQLTPGTYDFKLSGWTWQYESDTQDNAAWVRGDLYNETSDHIVGDPGWFGAVGSDTNTAAYNGTKWVNVTNTFNNVQVQGSASLVVTQRANGYGNVGHGSALSDDWSLTAKRIN